MQGQIVSGEEKVLFRMPIPPGEQLTLVQGEEDLCIRRNGHLVAGCFWRSAELPKAIEEFRCLGRRLRGERGN